MSNETSQAKPPKSLQQQATWQINLLTMQTQREKNKRNSPFFFICVS
jgi:hypothetical protein